MKDKRPDSILRLEVSGKDIHLFTTLLQSGIEFPTIQGSSIKDFLCNLNGFTLEYLSREVETIFLDGSPIDTLEHKLNNNNPVLALSAAMPGLAGAIFRKNSFHSALRTETGNLSSSSTAKNDISVTLKLFNTVAKARGEELLREGVIITGPKLYNFFNRREPLLSLLNIIVLDEKQLGNEDFLVSLSNLSSTKLYIIGKDD